MKTMRRGFDANRAAGEHVARRMTAGPVTGLAPVC
jgi:hypothetical protein